MLLVMLFHGMEAREDTYTLFVAIKKRASLIIVVSVLSAIATVCRYSDKMEL